MGSFIRGMHCLGLFIRVMYCLGLLIRGMYCLYFFQFLSSIHNNVALNQIFWAIGKYLWGKKINEIRMMKQYKGVIGVTNYTIFKRTKENQLLRSLQSTAARYQLVPKSHQIIDKICF